MEKRYFYILRRWSWLVVIAAMISSLTAYLAIKDRPPTYEARAKLLVGPGTDAPNPDLNALRAGGQLMQTYAELVATGPFLQSVIDKLSLKISSEDLNKMIEVRTNPDTQILIITVQDKDPEQAVAIANAAAEALVNKSPSADDSPTRLLNEQMRNQAARLEQIIANSDATIEGLEADLRSLTKDETQGLIVLQTDNYLEKQNLIIQQLTQERGRLSDALNALTVLYDSLQIAPTNQVKIVEPAAITDVVVSQLRLTVLIAGGAGLMLALILALAYEYFSAYLLTSEELENVTSLPLLGTISRYKPFSHGSLLVSLDFPELPAAEDFRMLGTKLLSKIKDRNKSENLILSMENQKTTGVQNIDENRSLKSILAFSSQLSDDNREFAANLAVVLAQVGLRVVLVDADLRKAWISKLFGLEGKPGLSDYLKDSDTDPKALLETFSNNLFILPSGQIMDESESQKSFELLASSKLEKMIEALEQEADVVLFASPPVLSSAGSLVLASQVDGAIVIAREGKTTRETVNDAVESLTTLDVPIIGVVFDHNPSSHLPLLRKQSLVEKMANWLPSREKGSGEPRHEENVSILPRDGRENLKSEALPLQPSKN
jgi:capsular exopolysaccharide synthesis family protein